MTIETKRPMRAAWYDRPGPARDVFTLGEMPLPSPEAGEVLVHIKASGINPSDYKRRENFAGIGNGARMVPHSDGAGIIEQVGEGVSRDWIGRAVWLWNAVNRHGYAPPGPRETGTAAEYVVLPLENVAPLPGQASFETGACLGVPAFTAYAAVYADGDPGGKVLLVQGGAGAVGELAIQLGAAAGATIVTTVSSPEKAERARAAGAHHIIDYRRQDVIQEVAKLFPDGVDHIIEVDFGANIEADARMIKPYGMIASYSSTSNLTPTFPYYDLQFKGVTVKTLQIFTMPKAQRDQAILAIANGLERGILRPSIAARYPLSDISTAHEHAENRPHGNIVIAGAGGDFL